MIRVRSFEFAILDWIQAHLRNPAMDLLMPALTALGNSGLIWIILAGVRILMPKYRKAGAAVLIAFSRLYLYVHYPTGVVAGLLIGTMAGWIGAKFAEVVWSANGR